MTLGDILKMAADKDLAGKNVNGLSYIEIIRGSNYHVKLFSSVHKDAFVECELPYSGKEDEVNYLRTYFLSMVFNAAIAGMKRIKNKKKNKFK